MKLLGIHDVVVVKRDYILAGVTLLKKDEKVQVVDFWAEPKAIVVQEIDQETDKVIPCGKIWPVPEEYLKI